MGTLVRRVRKGTKQEVWKVSVNGKGGKVYVPLGFGSIGLEVLEDDFRLVGDRVIHRSLVKRRLKVRGGSYDKKVWTYTKQGYSWCLSLVRQAVDKVWAGRGYRGKAELDGIVKEQLIKCLLVHTGKRGFWLRRYDRNGKVIHHREMAVMVARNYLIDIARYLGRRGIAVSNSALLMVFEKRDGVVRVKE